MHALLLAQQFELNHHVAHANLAGITHEESLVHPSPAGNCLNWVFGHVVATRNTIMDTLGEPRIWKADAASDGTRGSRGAARTSDDPPQRWRMPFASMIAGSCWHASAPATAASGSSDSIAIVAGSERTRP